MSDFLLTEQEIIDLTGFRQKSRQIEKLKADRIPYTVSRTGHPRVVRARVEGVTSATKRKKEPAGPRWEAIGVTAP